MRTMTRVILMSLTAAMMAACSASNGGLETEMPLPSQGGDGNNGQNDPSAPNSPLQQVDMKGYADGGEFQGVKTVDLDKNTGELIISLPLGIDSSVIIGSATIPQLPGVTFSTTIGGDGRTYVVMRVPLRYILRSVNLGTIPANRLPNGDPLPMMPAGEYPNLAFSLATNNGDQRRIYIYLGVDAIGVYVESKWLDCSNLPICLNLTVPVKNAAKTKVLGYLTMVMAKNGHQGGFFLGTKIPAEFSRILDEYFIH